MADITYQPITLHLDDNEDVIRVTVEEVVRPIQVAFGSDLAAIASLSKAVADDRQAIEDMDIPTLHSDVVAKHGEVASTVAKVQAVADQVADIDDQYDDIKAWHDAHDSDKAAFTLIRDDMVASEANYLSLRDDLNKANTDFQVIQSDITAKQTDVHSRHGDINNKYAGIVARHAEVEDDREEVATNRQDVEDRQSDVIARQNDVIARQSAIASTATDYLTDIQAAGDTQTGRVTGEGNTQFNRVAMEGQAKVDAATAQATTATAQATTATAQATTATAQATLAINARDAVEADRTEVASNKQDIKTIQADVTSKQSAVTASASAAAVSEANALTSETGAAADAAQVASDKSAVTALRDEVEADRTEVAGNTALTLGYKNDAETARDEAVNAAAALTGAMSEAGGYDASGNTLPPKPASSTFWKITVAGTLDGVPYGVGDTLVYSLNLDQFYKIDNTEAVTSVNGQQGVVTLTATQVGALPASTSVTDLNGLTVSQVNTLLAGKADSHPHPYRSDTWVPSWTDVTDKPGTFTPSAHSHGIAGITGLQAALDSKAATGHSHDIAEITGLQTALDAKADTHLHPYRPDTWVPAWDDITGKPTDFASSDHDHAIADVTGLQAALDAKLADAPENGKQHARIDGAWAEVDGLPDQTGQAGKTLQTDGTTASWQMPSGGDVTEAPEDGKLYFRKDGQWQAVEDTYLESSPVGITALWDGSSTPPAGWLERNGQEIFENQYPELFALYRDKIEAGRAFLPDDRGEFLRGWDNGRGVDDGRALGSHQGDAIRNITGDIRAKGGTGLADFAGAASGAFKTTTAYNYIVGHMSGTGYNVNFDASRVVPTANENRSRNNAVMVIIKAVSGPNLLSQIATPQRTVINASTGQQNFSHSYEVGRPLWVYMNGVKLIQGDDFTATDGSTISLTSPLVADTDIEIESFGKIVLSDMIGDSPHDGQGYVRKDGAWVTEKIADYALLDFGTITKNNRYVQDNPFGNNTPVFCISEIYHNGKWANTNWAYSSASSNGFGALAHYVRNEGVVVQTGQGNVINTNANDSGAGHGHTSSASSAPCRVHVWRVGV